MRSRRFRGFLVVLGLAIVGSAASPGGGLTTSSVAETPEASTEHAVQTLPAKMTLEEKLQHRQLLADWQATDAEARAGVGGVFSLTDPVKINHLQQVAVNESRLHIPILFAFDTIHGYRTIFPIPLGEASSFDPTVARIDASTGADESAHNGIKQVFAPMIDVSHDPRWGRVAEGAGEHPFLGSAFAVARVQGSQGPDMSAADKVVATAKHFVAYGQPEGGRDYNTADMSTQRLWNFYLPPFKAAVRAGIGTVIAAVA